MRRTAGTYETVAGDGARKLLLLHLAVEAHHGQRGGVADSLGGRHEEDQRHRHDGAQVELGRERHELRQCEQLHALEAAEVDRPRNHGAMSSNEGPYFDVNQDWSVDTFDALLALQSAVGLRTISWPEGMAFPE